MTRPLPELHEGRDGLRNLFKLVNEMRRNLAGPACLTIPVGPVDVMTTGQTVAVPANATGFVTKAVDVVMVSETGVQIVGPTVSVGTVAPWADIVNFTTLGAPLLTDTSYGLTVLAPTPAPTNIIYFNVQTIAGGPTAMALMVYLTGFYR